MVLSSAGHPHRLPDLPKYSGQDGSHHGAAASLGEDTLIRIYERATVHSGDDKTRFPVADFLQLEWFDFERGCLLI
jgi:hypothetical protein